MTDFALDDAQLRAALTPAPYRGDVAELALAVSDRARATRQRRRGVSLPWIPSPAATLPELRRARLARLVVLALLLAAAAGVVAAGARLLPPPAAPPQWILVQNGGGFTVPLGGGERRVLPAFAGLGINDLSTSWDGTHLATVRGARNEILEVWDAAAVFAERSTTPLVAHLPGDVRMRDAGVWRRDGRGVILWGSERGATRLFLFDLATLDVTQVSPDGVSVDDWQPSPDGRWIEYLGQRGGNSGLYLLEIESRTIQLVLESDGQTIPVGSRLGWSPDSVEMTVGLERGVTDVGTWALRVDGAAPPRRITPVGQIPWSMQWSPDGSWIAYFALASDQTCAQTSISSWLHFDTWLIRPDGTDAHPIAPSAFPIEWSADSRSILVESQVARPDAPLGGVIRVFLDDDRTELVYPYTEADRIPDAFCHEYGVATKPYRGVSPG